MALTINPAVSGSRAKFLLDSGAFIAGVFTGALASALLVLVAYAAAVSVLPEAWVLGAALLAIGWGVLHDLGVPVWMPYRPGQVPEWLRTALPHSAVAGVFGMQLGVGFLTFFTYSTQIAMLVAIPFLDGLGPILLVIAVFSIGKSLVLLTTLGTQSVQEITPRLHWTGLGARGLRLTTAAVSALVGLALVGVGG